MTALSDLIMRNPNSKSVTETLQHAELWSKKSLDIAMQHSSASSISNVARDPNCDIALAFAAYNVGILKKVFALGVPLTCPCLSLVLCADDGRQRKRKVALRAELESIQNDWDGSGNSECRGCLE